MSADAVHLAGFEVPELFCGQLHLAMRIFGDMPAGAKQETFFIVLLRQPITATLSLNTFMLQQSCLGIATLLTIRLGTSVPGIPYISLFHSVIKNFNVHITYVFNKVL